MCEIATFNSLTDNLPQGVLCVNPKSGRELATEFH